MLEVCGACPRLALLNKIVITAKGKKQVFCCRDCVHEWLGISGLQSGDYIVTEGSLADPNQRDLPYVYP